MFEFSGRAVLASALNLEITLDGSMSAVLESLKATGLAGAVGLAMFVVGDALGKMAGTAEGAAWASHLEPELPRRFPLAVEAHIAAVAR